MSEKEAVSFVDIMKKAGQKALGGGLAGSAAMVVQVTTLMWMRTTMNYQYRYGMSTGEALKTLYKEGGILRFYRGYGPALLQGPLSRFGDTAANVGVLALADSMEMTKDWPTASKTVFASAGAACMRIFLTPIDTVKTIMQVEGQKGLTILFDKAKKKGPTVYYHGALASASATFAGHYPFFFTYNTLQAAWPKYDVKDDANAGMKNLGRTAAIGFSCSAVSDSISNPLRVIKTFRQTNAATVSYAETIKSIVDKEGVGGMWGRGLKTRIATNGMQAMMFTVMWNQFMDVAKKNGWM